MSAAGGVLIVGATSGMGRALARRLAADGHPLILAGRDTDALGALATDLEVRSECKVEVRAFEALEFESHAGFFAECVEHFAGDLHGLVLCHGQMPEQVDAEMDVRVDNGVIRNDRAEEPGMNESAGRVRGKLGRGGPLIKLRTSNGTVSIH